MIETIKYYVKLAYINIQKIQYSIKLNFLQRKEIKLHIDLLKYCLLQMIKISIPRNDKEREILIKNVDHFRRTIEELDEFVTNVQHRI